MSTVLDHDQDERSLTPRSAIRHRPIVPDVLGARPGRRSSRAQGLTQAATS